MVYILDISGIRDVNSCFDKQCLLFTTVLLNNRLVPLLTGYY